MNNVTSIKPKHPRLQEVNRIRSARELFELEDLHDKWNLELSPLLTLQDLANGTKKVQKIGNEQKKTLDEMATPKRKAA